MIDKLFIDTNILVYPFDKSNQIKHEKIKLLITNSVVSSRLYISAQVLNEFINVVTRKIRNKILPENLKTILFLFDEMFSISPIGYETTLSAIDLNIKYDFSFWDSLIIASAIENNCKYLVSEDMNAGQLIENKLQILNPFHFK